MVSRRYSGINATVRSILQRWCTQPLKRSVGCRFEAHTGRPGHLMIGDHEVHGWACSKPVEGFASVASGLDLESFATQGPLEGRQHVRFVIDQKDDRTCFPHASSAGAESSTSGVDGSTFDAVIGSQTSKTEPAPSSLSTVIRPP